MDQFTMPKPKLRQDGAGRFHLDTTYRAIMHLRGKGWEIRRRGTKGHSARRAMTYMDRLDDHELRWLARHEGWKPAQDSLIVKVLVEYPGYWAHGRTMAAYRHDVPIRGDILLPCWILLDEERGELGIGVGQARIIEGTAP